MIDPYSKITTIDFWTDEYISKNMLLAHIDPDTDAASRKPETIFNTVDFISGLISKDKIICDFGCGPGLYTNLLNKKGFKVKGIDISNTSLNYARGMNKDVEYINKNYVLDKLEEPVDFISLIYCDLGALDPHSVVSTLKNVRDSLKENGLFFFDVMSYNWFDSVEESLDDYTVTDGFFMKGEAYIISRVCKYPKLKLVCSHHRIKGYKTVDYYNWDKCYDKEEISILLKDNGFEVIDIYSNTFGEKNFKDNETLAILCKKV